MDRWNLMSRLTGYNEISMFANSVKYRVADEISYVNIYYFFVILQNNGVPFFALVMIVFWFCVLTCFVQSGVEVTWWKKKISRSLIIYPC